MEKTPKVRAWKSLRDSPLFHASDDEARSDYLQEVRMVLESQLRDANGTWIADYVRLRFAATKARN